MSDNKELKPKSFRIDEETAEKFKAISVELGNNQQQTLSKLIETYELQKGKTVLTNKKGEIETFEKYITLVTRMYMDSLEHNQNVSELVRADFEALLQSKDETIIDLQEKVKNAEKARKESEETKNQSQLEVEQQSRYIEELEGKIEEKQVGFDSLLEDKEKVIQALTQACEGLKKDIENLEKATLEKSVIATKKMQLQQDYQSLESKYLALETEYHKTKLSHERELLKQEIEFNKQLNAIDEKRKQEVDEYQAKYLELLNRMQQNTKQVRLVKQPIK